jgi:hypothetical protein
MSTKLQRVTFQKAAFQLVISVITSYLITYWIYLLPSTQQTVGYNSFTTTCFDSHESPSGFVQNLLALAVLLLTVLEVVGRYEVVAVLTLI